MGPFETLGRNMNFRILLLWFAAVASAWAVMSNPVTPQSYVLSFVGEVIPPEAKVVGVVLQVDAAEAIRVRSLPPGWMASIFKPAGKEKFEVAAELLNWGEDRGVPVALADLNARFWIAARLEDEKPAPPDIDVTVHYISPAEDKARPSVIKRVKVPFSSLNLAYIP